MKEKESVNPAEKILNKEEIESFKRGLFDSWLDANTKYPQTNLMIDLKMVQKIFLFLKDNNLVNLNFLRNNLEMSNSFFAKALNKTNRAHKAFNIDIDVLQTRLKGLFNGFVLTSCFIVISLQEKYFHQNVLGGGSVESSLITSFLLKNENRTDFSKEEINEIIVILQKIISLLEEDKTFWQKHRESFRDFSQLNNEAKQRILNERFDLIDKLKKDLISKLKEEFSENKYFGLFQQILSSNIL